VFLLESRLPNNCRIDFSFHVLRLRPPSTSSSRKKQDELPETHPKVLNKNELVFLVITELR